MKQGLGSRVWGPAVVIMVLLLAVFGGDVGKFVGKRLYPPPPTAPLKVTFRPSKINGLVLQAQNTSDKYLSCKLVALNDTQKDHVAYSFSIDPFKMQEIGIMECGWAFMHGEKVLVGAEGYSDLYFTVP